MATILAALLMMASTDDWRPCDQVVSMPTWPMLSADVLRPGDRVTMRLMWRDGPFGDKPIPARCWSKLKVSGPAKLDKKGGLQIARKAKSGDVVVISVLLDGKPRTYRFAVTGRDEQVLTGKWSPQSRAHCQGRVPAEIVFGVNGRFSYTFPEQMIETMTSGGGTFRWDAASQELVLNDRDRGKAWFEGKALVIEGIDFDSVPPPLPGQPAPPPCRLVLG